MKKLFISTLLLGCLVIIGNAQIINVPGDQPSIQAGINAASDGDTVLVADSTYFENIDFKGKAITLASHFLVDGDTAHISKTIIDGSQPDHPDTASVVRMVSGEDTTSVLCGFTITGGRGTYTLYNDINFLVAGGLWIHLGGGKIVNNIIEKNNLPEPDNNEFVMGFGILAVTPGDRTIVIRNNTIRNNTFSGVTRGYAGGMYLGGSRIIVEGNAVSGNTITSDTEAVGGGIGYWYWDDVAGGDNPQVIIHNNRIFGNELSSGGYAPSGGGIFMRGNNLPLEALVYNNLIYDNLVHGDLSRGGGIEMWEIKPVIYNNTIVNNLAGKGKQIGIASGAEPALFNNIICSEAEDGRTEINIQPGEGASMRAEYNDICGGRWGGEGNIDEDPAFLPGTFELSHLSRCIGAGVESRDINGITYDAPALDYNGESRPQGDDGKVDLGALESVFPNPNYIRRVQHGDNDPVSVYPNPCRDHLTILMRNNQPVRMVEVLGLDGRILRVVDNARCNPLTIDRGNLPSGLYLLRIRSQETYVRKVLIE